MQMLTEPHLLLVTALDDFNMAQRLIGLCPAHCVGCPDSNICTSFSQCIMRGMEDWWTLQMLAEPHLLLVTTLDDGNRHRN